MIILLLFTLQIEITNENALQVIDNLTMSVVVAVEDDQIPINIDAITEVIVNTSVVAQLQTGQAMIVSNVRVQLQGLCFWQTQTFNLNTFNFQTPVHFIVHIFIPVIIFKRVLVLLSRT